MNLFERNSLANALNSFVTALLGVAVIPLLVRGLGVDSYGVVAIYATIQAVVFIFDMGWTATNGRQVARLRAGTVTSLHFENYFKSLQLIFYGSVIFILIGGFYN